MQQVQVHSVVYAYVSFMSGPTSRKTRVNQSRLPGIMQLNLRPHACAPSRHTVQRAPRRPMDFSRKVTLHTARVSWPTDTRALREPWCWGRRSKEPCRSALRTRDYVRNRLSSFESRSAGVEGIIMRSKQYRIFGWRREPGEPLWHLHMGPSAVSCAMLLRQRPLLR